MTTKEYKIGVCKTTDIVSGEDFLPPYYKVYSVETLGDEPPITWYEAEFGTLEEALAYTRELYKERSKANVSKEEDN